MEIKQVHKNTNEDAILRNLRRLAEDVGDGLILAWLDELAGGKRARSSPTTQPNHNGPQDAAGCAGRPESV
jgi:hypothetical protein